jgi:hypothetical protein
MFRIRFIIEGLEYAIVPLQPDLAVASKAYRFIKLAGDRTTYDVHLGEHGAECECKGFLRWRKPCKHIKTLVAAGMFPAEVLQPRPVHGGASDATQGE